jgi:microcystin degradation protein MlrC
MTPANAYSTTDGKLAELMRYSNALVQAGNIVDYSIFQVQPWLDLPEIATCVIVISNNENSACKYALELAQREFELRASLSRTLYSMDEVISFGRNNKSGKPIILVDSADSPNAGATCDSAAVLGRLLQIGGDLKAAFALNDPKTVELAFALGMGSESIFTVGSAYAKELSKPVSFTGRVISLHDGNFLLEGPAMRGQRFSNGKTAVLRAGNILILVCSNATRTGDPGFFRAFGIEPSEQQLVNIKACTSFRSSYESISSMICDTYTPGLANPNLTELPYKKLPHPLYPFDEISENDISAPDCFRNYDNKYNLRLNQ